MMVLHLPHNDGFNWNGDGFGLDRLYSRVGGKGACAIHSNTSSYIFIMPLKTCTTTYSYLPLHTTTTYYYLLLLTTTYYYLLLTITDYYISQEQG